MPLLELRDVGARYGGVEAVRGVSLTVDEGEVVALLGPNGAGKTTTLAAICGAVKTSGEVLLDDTRLRRRTPESMARRGIVQVPQGRGTFAGLSVLENLRIGAWTRRTVSGRDLAHVFEVFPRLYERRDVPAETLSGGEQQMLALGRAMMAKPRLLLVDEPSLGHGPAVVGEVYRAIRTLNERGAAVLVVEQRARTVLGAASRAVVLAAGTLAFAGAAGHLLRDETTRRAFLGY